MNSSQKFSIDELSQLSGISRRSIRWYIQQKLIDRPEGLNCGAYYLRKHLDQLLLIRKWQENGLNLRKIRNILRGTHTAILPPKPRHTGEVETFKHILLARGVELVIDPKEAELNTPQVQLVIRAILDFLELARTAVENTKKEHPPHRVQSTLSNESKRETE